MAEVMVKLEVTDKQCADIICTALEGGIGYWCCADKVERTGTKEEREAGAEWEYVGFDAYDDEDHNKLLGHVSYTTIRDGIERVLTGAVNAHSRYAAAVLYDIVNDEMGMKIDADVADVIVQAGLLNEIRFG